ncbi:unsaturated rhamnogalacturonyl hydrolase [Paenibacillus sp. V4I3]|uniref:glycoside hydrolase family 88 protein n=1 Tax=Paenibacillus sp. V4I3 TaxID=3042305 RepID=UPI002781C1E2|nr:glycoside hydrolase family 88 protein [Paenibacillus sp. V4I3]MDQ0873657.1 unsaturated rhamnogalacturonyl hydrolase [Paenibacillus sp. V4I3]
MNPLYISQKLYEHYEHMDEVKHYYGLLSIYALLQTAEEKQDRVLLEKCKHILSRFPDRIEHPRYNFPSYRIGGIPKAYALMKGYMPEASNQVREYAEEMMTATRDRKGIMSYPYAPEEELIWIDVAMAVTPYLLFAGLALDEQRYIDEAANQTFLMYEEFLDSENGLLHQSKNWAGPGKFSEDHWSRGNGWGYMPLAELVQHLPPSSVHRPKAEKYFKDLSTALLPYQSKRGLWRQEIPFEYSYEETSGTGLILYGIGIGLRMGLLDKDTYFPVLQKGIEGLNKISINPDYSTERSCPGCLCPGEGEDRGTVQSYVTLMLPHRDEHHSFAPLMFSMVEAYRNGIYDVPRND